MKRGWWLAAVVGAMLSSPSVAAAQGAPVAPASAASLVEPITLRWGAVVDRDGPIGAVSGR